MSDDFPSVPEVAVEIDGDSTEAADYSHCAPSQSQSNLHHPSEDLSGVDGLVRHMRRHTLTSEPTTTTTTSSTLKPSVAPDHHRQQRTSSLNGSPDQSNDAPGEQLVYDYAANGIPHAPTDTKRLRRQTEARHYKSTSSLRSLTRVTDMVENGVQCNVRSSTSSLAPQPANPACTIPIEPGNGPDPDMLEDAMDLEVDLGYREQDDKPLLDDTMALRHAGTPAGISKFGSLRYRSSRDVALSSKNLKRNVPRMRRRPENKTPPPTSKLPQTAAAV
ncbi:hypothetical protein F5X96DRAFT_649687 [Biscogniauxia mediterranea]|nr:hypothetical protein F5X96DRAFT_649687 [Biscogniauxia mediterranea]